MKNKKISYALCFLRLSVRLCNVFDRLIWRPKKIMKICFKMPWSVESDLRCYQFPQFSCDQDSFFILSSCSVCSSCTINTFSSLGHLRQLRISSHCSERVTVYDVKQSIFAIVVIVERLIWSTRQCSLQVSTMCR